MATEKTRQEEHIVLHSITHKSSQNQNSQVEEYFKVAENLVNLMSYQSLLQ